ncbi:syntaxin-17-like [Elysia marginata]|uniref:Syntaxin-17-like n=1 Tax=Elysia marginata TaxID=1093978 RepID=A0AAV4I364_9GAST|nr:syntaxin-17-like [Elysia marginata]
MASFDREELREQQESRSSDTTGLVKYPVKRLELSIRNFIKVLDIDLDRLHRHSENIKKLTNAEDWRGLHKEQVNASRTVQQINANIREVERTRTQVVDKDLALFDSRVQGVKTKAVVSMEQFMILIGPGLQITTSSVGSKERPAVETGHGSDTMKWPTSLSAELDQDEAIAISSSQSKQLTHRPTQFPTNQRCNEDLLDSAVENNKPSSYGNTSVSLMTYEPAPVTTSLHVAPQHTDASISWEQLQENIVELNDLVHNFADRVEEQGEVINTIEENIETAHSDIQEGTASLAQASKYKAALLPVVGAVMGGMVGGPIGFVAGMKLGGLAGVMGGAAGLQMGPQGRLGRGRARRRRSTCSTTGTTKIPWYTELSI